MFSYMTLNHSTISIHNHSTLLGLGLENDGKQMISNCLQGKLDRLWMIRADRLWGWGGSSVMIKRSAITLGRIDRFPREVLLRPITRQKNWSRAA